MDTIPKPDELLALDGVTAELFALLQDWFDVPTQVPLDLAAVDSAVQELSDPTMIAALAMRKLQALHLLATPGVRTTTDVVVTIVQDLNRALLQAPAMRLKVAASTTDWDAALAEMVSGDDAEPDPGSAAPGGEDADAERFRALHGALHAAVRAVLEASEGEIRYLL